MPEPVTSPEGLFGLTRRLGRAHFAFTQRRGGVSRPPFAWLNLGLHVGDAEEAVTQNRQRVLAALRVDARRLVEAEQVHGAEVAVIDEAWLQRYTGPRFLASGCDALVTDRPDVVLSLYFADCVPLFLTDSAGEVFGLAHAGWRGTAAGVAMRAVQALSRAFGTAPGSLLAFIGPCIGACCYEVGEEVVEAVSGPLGGQEPPGRAVRLASSRGKWLLDLAAANSHQLVATGIPADAIEAAGRCTCCEGDVFFSVRGDGQTTGRCGAFAYLSD